MRDLTFGQFRLDLNNECLWQGTRAISLRPKAFALLKTLLDHPGQLVNKQDLLESVWPDTFVSDAVLKDNIRQLREALHDDAASPIYIETAHRRGYRFIGKLSAAAPRKKRLAVVPALIASASPATTVAACSTATPGVLGRETELAKMRGWLDLVLAGERQTVFITGEAGIGKTTMVQAFLEQAGQIPEALIVRGQCLEHFGSGEAYLPVLDGFSRLCRSSAGALVLDVLREQAPSWLTHISRLAQSPESAPLQSQAPGATRERMLREMAEAIEKIAGKAPLLLVLEDLHWSDYATLDLISYLARRRDPARLMIIGTYRPVDVILAEHPLRGVKRELQAHRLCHELPLEYLTEEAIGQYLAARFPHHQLPIRLRRTIYRRTDGNPLFMVNVVEYLIDQKVIVEEHGSWRLSVQWPEVEHGVPSSVKALIEKQIERLSPDERAVLEAASATGMEFSTVAVAAGLDKPIDWVNKHCEELARRHQFLSAAWLGELPGGIVTARHRFNHVLFREVPYSLISAMRRSQIHQRIAERAVEIYRERASEIAAELAMHFEQSRDWPRAVQYLIEAAKNAAGRSAHHEAAELGSRGLEALKQLPQTTQRAHQELTLLMIRSISLIAINGFAAADVDRICTLGKELLNQPSPQRFNVLILLLLFYQFSGKLDSARETGEQLLQIAETLGDLALIMEAHRALGAALLDMGRCSEALEHFEVASSLYAANRNHTLTIAHDCKVVSECFAARALWALGHSERSLARMQEALAFARDLGQPRSWALAAHFSAQLHQLRGEPLLALERAQEVVKVSDEYGMDFWMAFGNIDLGWAESELGKRATGIERMKQGLDAHMANGAKLWCPYSLGLLASQFAKAGRMDEAHGAIAQAFTIAEQSEEWYSRAELERIKAELIRQTSEGTQVPA